jgi:hypothetical protein
MKAPRKYATNTRTGPVGRPFQSGNAGKPRGARHRTTQAVEALLDGEAEKLTRKAIEMAPRGRPDGSAAVFRTNLPAAS